VFPKIFTIGDFFLPTYGVLVALGFLAGLAVTLRLARQARLDTEKIGNLAVYCALAGLAGAKLLMFAFDANYYLANPGRILSLETLLSAGVYYGGFLTAVAFAWFYVRRQKLRWLPVADVFAPGLALGHAIGRLGCFAAGCCWGLECDRPWAVTFLSSDAHALTGVPLGVKLHPAQLYEAALTFLVFLAVYARARRPHSPGAILGLYLVLYSAARFLVEFVRAHEQAFPFNGPFSTTQWIALGLFLTGLWLLRPQPPGMNPSV
jgi:phosphatidylglycerol---prolipoprotein diacylglyceryl transferase